MSNGTYGPQMTDPATDRALFATRCIELCCEDCKEKGATASCNHLLHLVPSWQSEERHRKLKVFTHSERVYALRTRLFTLNACTGACLL